MSQTKPIGNESALSARKEILRLLLARGDREGLDAYGTDDVGKVERIAHLRGTGKKGVRGQMYCGPSVILVCLEGDRQWQPLPGHQPSVGRKKADLQKHKEEMKRRTAQSAAQLSIPSAGA